MKKIMFNSHIGLEAEVLNGYKTMTRRALPDSVRERDALKLAKYRVGEVIAVAQSYKAVSDYLLGEGRLGEMLEPDTYIFRERYLGAGWNNKMFVRAEDMPHRIEITDVKAERLLDISDWDCFREGVRSVGGIHPYCRGYTFVGSDRVFQTPVEAFRSIIDISCGRDLWLRNPLVVCYTFSLLPE